MFYCNINNFYRECMIFLPKKKLKKLLLIDNDSISCITKCQYSSLKSKLKTSPTKQRTIPYIKDNLCAEKIAKYLCVNFEGGFIYEANPGPGILSKAILNENVKCLKVFEKNGDFIPVLNKLAEEYNNLEFFQEDIFQHLIILEAKKLAVADSSPFFKDIPLQSWENGIPFRFFSVICDKRSIRFVRFLLAVLPSKSSIFSCGRFELVLLLSESEFKYLNAEPKEDFSVYRWTTVICKIFFKIEYLEKFPFGIFHSVPIHGKKKIQSDFYLVKLTPRQDLFSSVVYQNRLQDFFFFIRHHLVKRSGYIIPTLESWVPFCGPRLIKDGMNVFTKFGDLSPAQLLHLFNQFSSWPEYEASPFQLALRKFYEKGDKGPPPDDEACDELD